jgi:hypothetical protein
VPAGRSASLATGLVAAYGFDEGAGSQLADASGNGHTGTISGGTWVPGRFGNALSFDGTSAFVDLGSLGTFYQSGFTLEAWVKKSGTKKDAAVVGTWTSEGGGGPMMWVDHIAGDYELTLGNVALSGYLDSGTTPSVGQWQHIAATFDGTTARFYVDGTEVANRTVTGSVGTSNTWRIGAYGSSPDGFFDGAVDDVRIYNHALSAAEIQNDMNQPVTVVVPPGPSAPDGFTVTSRTGTTIATQWNASAGATGYNLYLNGSKVGTATGTSFTFGSLSCSTSYQLGVEAFDGSGNVSSRTVLNTPTALCAPPTGLVAEYAFDEGSGTSLADASGNGHTGTITGATWVPGHSGDALSFNGTGAFVDLGSLGTFYQSGFTLEAWVKKSGSKKDAAVLGSWTASGGPMIWVDHLAGDYQLTLGTSGLSGYLDSGATPVAGQWQHLAATYDGTTARFFVNGVEVANRAVSGSIGASDLWRIGAYSSPAGGFFDGTIDDVRIYNNALSAAQIQTDLGQPVPPPDTTAPSAPGTLTASGALGQAALSWGAATDNVGVTKYDVYRSTTSGFTPSGANRIAQVGGTTYTNTNLAAGTYYYRVTAEDAAGNVGAASNEASAVVAGDTTPPTVSITGPSGGSTATGTVTLSATAADDQGVAGVQFKVDGESIGSEVTASPYSVAWDSRGVLNGTHTLTAVARDTSGNTTTSAGVTVTVNNPPVSMVGLRASYGFDDGSGTSALDFSGNDQTATLAGGAGWGTGHFGSAVSLNGTSSYVDVPALGTFYKTGFTYEAWVKKQSSRGDAAIVGTWIGTQGGGPMLWVDHLTGHYRLTFGTTFANYLDSGVAPAVGQWQHVAATWDGSVARIYVDGVQTASETYTGNPGDATTWRIGAYGSPAGGFFDGSIDNVRIYDHALTASEIQTDMATRVAPESTPPTVTAKTPASGATGVNVGSSVTVTFSEAMKASTITASSILLKTSSNTTVPATVTYDANAKVATLAPQSALQYGATYTATVKGGTGGVTDLAGNALVSDVNWSFSTEVSTANILVVTSASNPFSSYATEILRNEGLDDFTTIDVSLLSSSLLNHFDVVVLGDTSVTASQVSLLTTWVNAGGNLVAMHPDKQLASLLGLTDAGSTLTNGYLKVNTLTAPGAGITSTTIQFHGTADRYALNGATAVATLYSNATTATSNPAVTLRSVGTSGGQAAAFTFDLARSVVYTRQGNPAWAGEDRDGVPAADTPADLFYGAMTGDVQPDWLDTTRISIPQADEEQRLLVNLITLMERDKAPLPHFWYLPRGYKAAVVMSGDDHAPDYAPGGTASNFDRFEALSPPGCVVANWACVRSTSYLFADNPVTNAQAATYVSQGFEIALHPVVASCPTTVPTVDQLATVFNTQLADFAAKYTSIPAPQTSRTHCIEWPDWASEAKIELSHGIRMDANYYPDTWIGSKAPGFMNGGGFPMRFADTDGTQIDVYQSNTNVVDDAGMDPPTALTTLLDNALGSQGFYGAFGVNLHNDNPAPQENDEEIVAAAQARGVPIISYKQLLDWTDGRNNSTIRSLAWSAGTLTFVTTVAAGANGLQTLLPMQGPSGTLRSITVGGNPVSFTVQTIKGVQYAAFTTVSGSYRATYA